MRLVEYMNDSGKLYPFLDRIKRECSAWLKESHYIPIWTNFPTVTQDLYVAKYPYRHSYGPEPYPESIDSLDKHIEKVFGWKARRNGLRAFAYPAMGVNDTPMLVFPTGKYRYLWSPKVDSLSYFIGYDRKVHPEVWLDFKGWTDTGLLNYLKNHRYNEITIDCESCYAINAAGDESSRSSTYSLNEIMEYLRK